MKPRSRLAYDRFFSPYCLLLVFITVATIFATPTIVTSQSSALSLTNVSVTLSNDSQVSQAVPAYPQSFAHITTTWTPSSGCSQCSEGGQQELQSIYAQATLTKSDGSKHQYVMPYLLDPNDPSTLAASPLIDEQSSSAVFVLPLDLLYGDIDAVYIQLHLGYGFSDSTNTNQQLSLLSSEPFNIYDKIQDVYPIPSYCEGGSPCTYHDSEYLVNPENTSNLQDYNVLSFRMLNHHCLVGPNLNTYTDEDIASTAPFVHFSNDCSLLTHPDTPDQCTSCQQGEIALIDGNGECHCRCPHGAGSYTVDNPADEKYPCRICPLQDLCPYGMVPDENCSTCICASGNCKSTHVSTLLYLFDREITTRSVETQEQVTIPVFPSTILDVFKSLRHLGIQSPYHLYRYHYHDLYNWFIGDAIPLDLINLNPNQLFVSFYPASISTPHIMKLTIGLVPIGDPHDEDYSPNDSLLQWQQFNNVIQAVSHRLHSLSNRVNALPTQRISTQHIKFVPSAAQSTLSLLFSSVKPFPSQSQLRKLTPPTSLGTMFTSNDHTPSFECLLQGNDGLTATSSVPCSRGPTSSTLDPRLWSNHCTDSTPVHTLSPLCLDFLSQPLSMDHYASFCLSQPDKSFPQTQSVPCQDCPHGQVFDAATNTCVEAPTPWPTFHYTIETSTINRISSYSVGDEVLSKDIVKIYWDYDPTLHNPSTTFQVQFHLNSESSQAPTVLNPTVFLSDGSVKVQLPYMSLSSAVSFVIHIVSNHVGSEVIATLPEDSEYGITMIGYDVSIKCLHPSTTLIARTRQCGCKADHAVIAQHPVMCAPQCSESLVKHCNASPLQSCALPSPADLCKCTYSDTTEGKTQCQLCNEQSAVEDPIVPIVPEDEAQTPSIPAVKPPSDVCGNGLLKPIAPSGESTDGQMMINSSTAQCTEQCMCVGNWGLAFQPDRDIPTCTRCMLNCDAQHTHPLTYTNGYCQQCVCRRGYAGVRCTQRVMYVTLSYKKTSSPYNILDSVHNYLVQTIPARVHLPQQQSSTSRPSVDQNLLGKLRASTINGFENSLSSLFSLPRANVRLVQYVSTQEDNAQVNKFSFEISPYGDDSASSSSFSTLQTTSLSSSSYGDLDSLYDLWDDIRKNHPNIPIYNDDYGELLPPPPAFDPECTGEDCPTGPDDIIDPDDVFNPPLQPEKKSDSGMQDTVIVISIVVGLSCFIFIAVVASILICRSQGKACYARRRGRSGSGSNRTQNPHVELGRKTTTPSSPGSTAARRTGTLPSSPTMGGRRTHPTGRTTTPGSGTSSLPPTLTPAYDADEVKEFPLPPGWVPLRDQNGRVYYSNQDTLSSTWVHPGKTKKSRRHRDDDDDHDLIVDDDDDAEGSHQYGW